MSETIPGQLPPPRRQVSIATIVSAVMAVLLIIAGGISYFVYHNNQGAQDTLHATATAFAIPGLTATAVATSAISPYAPFTEPLLEQSLISPAYGWSTGPFCQFSAVGYKVTNIRPLYIQRCIDTRYQFGEMAYQITMTIHTGDCGGLIFGYQDVNNFYIFEVCQQGVYNVAGFFKGKWIVHYPFFAISSAIRKGLNVQNRIAITVKGFAVNMYVNGQHIDMAINLDSTGNDISQGCIGLFVNYGHNTPTSVIYTNALVWTT
jgi:hypothetical protein